MKDTQTALALADQQSAIQPITPMGMLQIAVSQGADLDKLQKLMELQERWEANEARKAYDAAMAMFKSSPPRITKNKHVEFGQTKYDHATLDHVTDVLTASLSKVGISHRFETKQSAQTVTVVCILRHEKGHSERTELTGPIDASGSKNAIQQIGSAVTYLQRYTLLAAVGMAAGGDDDGSGSGKRPEIPEQAYIAHMDNIQNAGSNDELKRLFATAYEEARKVGDKDAMAAFIKAKDNRKAELAR